jgi:hypothetical protein
MNKFLLYVLIGIFCWIFIDFATTQAIKDPLLYYSTYMPSLLIFYIGFPVLNGCLIYKIELNDQKMFLFTLIEIFIVEILFTQNPLFFSFPFNLLAIFLAIDLYSILTFFPKWLVEKRISENKSKIILLWIICFLVIFLNSA